MLVYLQTATLLALSFAGVSWDQIQQKMQAVSRDLVFSAAFLSPSILYTRIKC